jgi:hypothetical protein
MMKKMKILPNSVSIALLEEVLTVRRIENRRPIYG